MQVSGRRGPCSASFRSRSTRSAEGSIADCLPSFGGRSDHLSLRAASSPRGGVAFGVKRVVGHERNSLSECGCRYGAGPAGKGRKRRSPRCRLRQGRRGRQGSRIHGRSLHRGEPSAPLPDGGGAGCDLPASRCAARTVAAGSSMMPREERDEGRQPMRLADLMTRASPSARHADKREPTFLDAVTSTTKCACRWSVSRRTGQQRSARHPRTHRTRTQPAPIPGR